MTAPRKWLDREPTPDMFLALNAHQSLGGEEIWRAMFDAAPDDQPEAIAAQDAELCALIAELDSVIECGPGKPHPLAVRSLAALREAAARIAEQAREIERLRECEAMYKGLCK